MTQPSADGASAQNAAGGVSADPMSVSRYR